jgi:hypothetical protein
MTVWWSKAILIGAVIAAVLLPLSAFGYKFDILALQPAFSLMSLAALLAAALLVLGIVAWIVAGKKGLSGERGGIATGLLISLAIVAFLGMQYQTAQSVPYIHNISTDTADPPAFDKVIAIRKAFERPDRKVNSLAYDADKLAPEQLPAYPQVKTLTVPETQAPTLAASEAVLREMGLEIVNVDEAAGRIEATATTFWFGFKDDVVVRVREGSDGSDVDVRSVSRVGESDLGANAARILKFLDGLRARVG